MRSSDPGICVPALVAPEAGETGGGTEFEQFGALPSRNGERLVIALLRRGLIAGGE